MHREVKREIGDDSNRVREYEKMPGRVCTVAFNREGNLFAAGNSLDGTGEVRVYQAEDGKVEITTEDNQAKAVLTGAAGANVFLGAESTASLSVTVVQEFEVTCSDPAVNQVVLTLESNLLGFIRG